MLFSYSIEETHQADFLKRGLPVLNVLRIQCRIQELLSRLRLQQHPIRQKTFYLMSHRHEKKKEFRYA